MKKMPKKLYVRKEKDNNEEYYIAETDQDACLENGTVIGVYKLVEVKKVEVNIDLIETFNFGLIFLLLLRASKRIFS